MFTLTDRRAAYAISSPLMILLQSSYILFLHHVLPILHICFAGKRFGQRAYAQGLDKMIIVWVVGPPIGRTSPPTNWSDCSKLTAARRSLCRRPVGWTAHRMYFIVSYARDSSMFGFFVQASPAKPETPQRSGSSCKSHRLSWGLPWCLDLAMYHRCAIKLLHAIQIRVLILGSTFGS